MKFEQNKGKYNNCDIRYTIKEKCYIDHTLINNPPRPKKGAS